MARWNQYLLLLLLAIWGGEMYAQKSVGEKVSALYGKYRNKDVRIGREDCAFLQRIAEGEVGRWPDTVAYQYHYLLYGVAVERDDMQKRFHHAEKALGMLETKLIKTYAFKYDVDYVDVCCKMGKGYEERGEMDKAILQYERALVRREWLLESEPHHNARRVKSGCLASLGSLYVKKGHNREALSCFEEAFAISNVDYKPGATDTYYPLRLICQFYMDGKDYEKAAIQIKRLIRFLDEHKAHVTKDCAEEYFRLGCTYDNMRDYKSAIASYKEAVSIYRQTKTAMKEAEECYSNLWCAYARVGNTEGFKEIKSALQKHFTAKKQKEEYFRHFWAATTLLPSDKAKPFMDELEKNFATLDASLQMEIMKLLSKYYFEQNNAEKCLTYCTKGIDIIKKSKLKGTAHETLGYFYETRAYANKASGKRGPAIDDAQNALGQYNKCKDKAASDRVTLLSCLQEQYIENGDYGKAVVTGNSLLSIIKAAYGEKSRGYIYHALVESVAMTHNKEYNRAIEFLKGLKATVLEVDGSRSAVYATLLRNMGRAYMLNGDKERAAAHLQEAMSIQLEKEGAVDSMTNQYLKELGYE